MASDTFFITTGEKQEQLGESFEKRGDLINAKKSYEKALTMYQKITNSNERKEKVEYIQLKIENLSNSIATNPPKQNVAPQSPKATPQTPAGGSSKSIPSSNGNTNAEEATKKDDPKIGTGIVDEQKLKEAMDKINGYIGISEVKKNINEWTKQIRLNQIKKSKGIEVPPTTYHMVFTGNAGTGKTSIARELAKVYHALGIIQEEKVIECDRAGLVGGYIGETAQKTTAVVTSAFGAILFIDEAYTLKKEDDGKDFGQEAIDTLLKLMEDHRDELIVIAAGYDKEMQRFINANPGLSSRFKNFINFTDYNGTELFGIFMMQVKKIKYIVTPEAEKVLIKYFDDLYINRDANFGNARTVRNFFEDLYKQQSIRLADLDYPSDEDLITFTLEDVQQTIKTQKLSASEYKKIEDIYRKTKAEITDKYIDDMICKALSGNGNLNDIAVKLVIRLESILRFKYKYTGDLFDMINQVIAKFGNIERFNILHKIRKIRNSTVHANEDGAEISLDDIRSALKVINEIDM